MVRGTQWVSRALLCWVGTRRAEGGLWRGDGACVGGARGCVDQSKTWVDAWRARWDDLWYMNGVWIARLRLVLLGVVVVGCVLPCVASGDSARRFGFGFGGPGEGAGELGLVSPLLDRLGNPEFTVGGSGVGVNAATGDVYVADTGNRRVDEFEASGSFMRAWGWGVADGAAKLESCGPDAVPPTVECRKGLAGAGPGELAGPRFVAVDNSGGASQGDVYVGDGVGSEAQDELPARRVGRRDGWDVHVEL